MIQDNSGSHIQQVRSLISSENVAFKKHSVLRMRQRNITVNEFKEAMLNGDIVECYEDDYPLPSALILGYTSSRRPLHAVVALDHGSELLWIITLYEPSLELWCEGFKKRRS